MNERIKELAIEAGYSMDMQQHQKFAELIVREVVSKMAVEGSNFYYNEPNNYGAITVRFFVEGDPNLMVGEEINAQYHDGIRGTGRYKLNDKFVKHLMKQHFGVK